MKKRISKCKRLATEMYDLAVNKQTKRLFRQYQKDTGKSDLFDLIPKDTYYCYSEKTTCIFWQLIQYSCDTVKNDQFPNGAGRCTLLNIQDMDILDCLWDQCKVCEINLP